jgi:hypothetical protein
MTLPRLTRPTAVTLCAVGVNQTSRASEILSVSVGRAPPSRKKTQIWDAEIRHLGRRDGGSTPARFLSGREASGCSRRQPSAIGSSVSRQTTERRAARPLACGAHNQETSVDAWSCERVNRRRVCKRSAPARRRSRRASTPTAPRPPGCRRRQACRDVQDMVTARRERGRAVGAVRRSRAVRRLQVEREAACSIARHKYDGACAAEAQRDEHVAPAHREQRRREEQRGKRRCAGRPGFGWRRETVRRAGEG